MSFEDKINDAIKEGNLDYYGNIKNYKHETPKIAAAPEPTDEEQRNNERGNWLEHGGPFGRSVFPDIDGNGNGEVKGHDDKAHKKPNAKSNDQEKDRESCAKILIKLGLENISQLFKDQYGYSFASIKIQDHNEIVALESSRFKKFLFKIFYHNFEDTPYSEALNNAIQVLSAKAVFDNPTFHLSLRVASSKDKNPIYYDLTNDNYQIVEISKTGWEIKTNQDILFTRYNQTPQVIPDRHYDSDIFDQFMKITNVKDQKNKLLLKVYIISLFIPDIPHPILNLHGEKGSAKSTLQTMIKRIVDPAKPELLTVNNKQEEFVQQLNHNHVAVYDNIKHTPLWLSDETCKAVTGIGNTKRKLYTDDEDIVYQYKRCVSFNGINIALTEPDALDRSIMIELERIKNENRRLESEVYAEFEAIRPKLLACIFDIIVKSLQVKDSIKLDNLPRMADFALWGEAIARVMGHKPLEFINAYYENIGKQNIEAIDSNPLGQAIVKLCEWLESDNKEKDKELEIHQQNGYYYGSASECLIKLTTLAASNNIDINSKQFPKAPNSLTRNFNKIRSNLLEGLGIEVIIQRVTTRTDNYSVGTSTLKITKIPSTPSTPSALDNSCSNSNKNVEDTLSVEDTIPSTHEIPSTQNDQNRAHIEDVEDVEDVEDTFATSMLKSESESKPEVPEECPNCGIMVDPFDKNTHPAVCNNFK